MERRDVVIDHWIGEEESNAAKQERAITYPTELEPI